MYDRTSRFENVSSQIKHFCDLAGKEVILTTSFSSQINKI